MAKLIQVFGAAFSGEANNSSNQFRVDGDDVRVWDSVAGYWTNVYSASESVLGKVRTIASQIDEGCDVMEWAGQRRIAEMREVLQQDIEERGHTQWSEQYEQQIDDLAAHSARGFIPRAVLAGLG